MRDVKADTHHLPQADQFPANLKPMTTILKIPTRYFLYLSMTLHAIEYLLGQSGWAVHPTCLVGQGGKQRSSPVVLKPGVRHSEYSEHLDTQQRPSVTGPKHLELEPWRVSSNKKPWRRHKRRSTEAGYFLLNTGTRKESNTRCKTVDNHAAVKIWNWTWTWFSLLSQLLHGSNTSCLHRDGRVKMI